MQSARPGESASLVVAYKLRKRDRLGNSAWTQQKTTKAPGTPTLDTRKSAWMICRGLRTFLNKEQALTPLVSHLAVLGADAKYFPMNIGMWESGGGGGGEDVRNRAEKIGTVERD